MHVWWGGAFYSGSRQPAALCPQRSLRLESSRSGTEPHKGAKPVPPALPLSTGFLAFSLGRDLSPCKCPNPPTPDWQSSSTWRTSQACPPLATTCFPSGKSQLVALWQHPWGGSLGTRPLPQGAWQGCVVQACEVPLRGRLATSPVNPHSVQKAQGVPGAEQQVSAQVRAVKEAQRD